MQLVGRGCALNPEKSDTLWGPHACSNVYKSPTCVCHAAHRQVKKAGKDLLEHPMLKDPQIYAVSTSGSCKNGTGLDWAPLSACQSLIAVPISHALVPCKASLSTAFMRPAETRHSRRPASVMGAEFCSLCQWCSGCRSSSQLGFSRCTGVGLQAMEHRLLRRLRGPYA